MAATRLAILSIPLALGFQLDSTAVQHKGRVITDILAESAQYDKEKSDVESNGHLLRESAELSSSQQRVLDKVARRIAADEQCDFAHLSKEKRTELAAAVRSRADTSFMDVLAPPSSPSRPRLVQPCATRPTVGKEAPTSLLESFSGAVGAGNGDFQPSEEFQAREAAASAAEAGQGLPWGIGSPRTGDSLPNFHYSAMPAIDFPKEWEYSLEAGDTIQSFSTNQQDVKLITQVLYNITNGYFLESHAGDGEEPSNTLLLELAGWRGLLIEPRPYHYLGLWGKMRKAWLFLGAISPNENFTRVGFDSEGNIDMLSGHQIHTYPVKDFMAEMGGRKTIDFWSLNSGGYEWEILNETILGSGKSIEFGVVLINFKGRMTGRGFQEYVTPRTKDTTEGLVYDVMNKGGFKYIGGLDAYWVNRVSPRYNFHDTIWVNPSYFEARGIPMPTSVKGPPPPPLGATDPPWDGFATWDSGPDFKEESKTVAAYFKKSKAAAASSEPVAKAFRTAATKLVV